MNDLRSCLEWFAGDWTGEEDIAPSKWGEGGRATAAVSARLDLNGRVLVQDYSVQRDGKPWLKAHALMAFDDQTSACSLYWFESLRFTPAEPAPGQWDGKALRFVRTSPRGQTRRTYIPAGPGAYELILEGSFDAGASWVPVLRGALLAGRQSQ